MEVEKAVPAIGRMDYVIDEKKHHLDVLLIGYEGDYYRYFLRREEDSKPSRIILSPINHKEFNSYHLLQDRERLSKLEKSIFRALNKGENTVDVSLQIVIEDIGVDHISIPPNN